MSFFMLINNFPLSSRYDLEPQKGVTVRVIEIYPGIFSLENSYDLDILNLHSNQTKFNEPEPHLDTVAEMILRNFVEPTELACFSAKDMSLRERLSRKSRNIFGDQICTKSTLTDGILSSISNGFGVRMTSTKKLFLIRHAVEHFPDLKVFFSRLFEFLGCGGYVYIEVPAFDINYSFGHHHSFWDEHFYYFTINGFTKYIHQLGCEIIWTETFYYPGEPCICALIKLSKLEKNQSNYQKETNGDFSKRVSRNISGWSDILSQFTSGSTSIHVIGSGHNSSNFLSQLPTYENIHIYDADPMKIGKFLPGSVYKIKDIKFFDINLSNRDLVIDTLAPYGGAAERLIPANHPFKKHILDHP